MIVGASQSDYYEIDPAMADRVRADAVRLGCADRLQLVEHTSSIEQYYRAADIFVLPSKREGLPNALLEAMACGLPSIVSRLPGVTDSVIDRRRRRRPRRAWRSRRRWRHRFARCSPMPASARAIGHGRRVATVDRAILARRDGGGLSHPVSRA